MSLWISEGLQLGGGRGGGEEKGEGKMTLDAWTTHTKNRQQPRTFSCVHNPATDSTTCASTLTRPTDPHGLMNRQRDGQNIKLRRNQTPETSSSY
ncbi:hypothetical protein RRG08_045514 [Elysia crispata]|uniref:Uncharacterized protein n=1 Tax=Elysia crispata TaxID=231223 RepID=A0AAE0ZW68_9GAST|nr:hypothetical protein RRG08_045514 [Elysia crispata]